jgi:hypothetical protein
MAGHPPFGAQVIGNGHEHVACLAEGAGVPFAKEGNCFTACGAQHPLAWPSSQAPCRNARL